MNTWKQLIRFLAAHMIFHIVKNLRLSSYPSNEVQDRYVFQIGNGFEFLEGEAVRVFRKMLGAWLAQDLYAMRSCIHPDCRWETPLRRHVNPDVRKMFGGWKGIDGFEEWNQKCNK